MALDELYMREPEFEKVPSRKRTYTKLSVNTSSRQMTKRESERHR